MLGLISLSLTVIIAVIGFITYRLTKARMRRALGRDVKKSEMNSISTWMEVVENEERGQR
jgi:hypothetical protein